MPKDEYTYDYTINNTFISTMGRGANGKGALGNIPGAGKGHNWKQKPVADTAIYTSYSTNSFAAM